MIKSTSPIAIQITNGCLTTDIEQEDQNSFQELQTINAIEEVDGLWKLKNIYRAGVIYIGKDGNGYLESEFKEQKDLLIESDFLNGAKYGDTVVAKRVIARRGRATAKVVSVIVKSKMFSICYTHRDEQNNFIILDIKTALPTHAIMEGMDLKAFKLGTVLKVDIETEKVLEVMGQLNDPKVDEKISLALFNREDEFPPVCLEDAKNVEQEVNKDDHPTRTDLTHLDFCTIDPVTAKDFDDAIYFDLKTYTLYVAIADVSHYVPYFTHIDKEAKKRGFTTYLPHKSFPMLPRELSENICSLKPNVDRLAFVSKIQLDKNTLQPIKEEFFEAIIHSKHRFNYDNVDNLLDDHSNVTGIIKEILKWLLPLQKITSTLRDNRLKKGFDFRSEETKLSIDSNHLLKDISIETGTPSHSLIEECMLLANQASAKRFKDDESSIYRIHEPPQLSRTEQLLTQLAAVGIFVEEYESSPDLIRSIQKEARAAGLETEVDSMVIKSLRQASYAEKNIGHFGLGFSHYSHFTSPIRRYADLILHRLIKSQLNDDTDQQEYLLRNIEPLCSRVSNLEREATKAEWDFRDRKFARWANDNIGNIFNATIIESGENAKAVIDDSIKGVVVNLKGDNVMLFDKIKLKLTGSNIAQTTILGQLELT